LPLDDLIVAIGQQAELDFLGDEPVRRNKSGYLDVNPETFETAVPNLYAGGDIASDGPASIVRALGDGRRIANDIRRKEENLSPQTGRPRPPPTRRS
jgi:glutamate synthase (NADPH/NADH) small chain